LAAKKASKKPSTAAEYLAGLPPERRQVVSAVRRLIRQHLPEGYAETLQYGMLSWVVPLKTYPQGYLGKKDVPLPYVSLASQKAYLSIYLLAVYGDAALLERFTASWKKSGKKLQMGKSCIRFKSLDDLALPALGEAIAAVPVAKYIQRYERARSR
jgi:hypothetical protein